jgi:hypothetical protein
MTSVPSSQYAVTTVRRECGAWTAYALPHAPPHRRRSPRRRRRQRECVHVERPPSLRRRVRTGHHARRPLAYAVAVRGCDTQIQWTLRTA